MGNNMEMNFEKLTQVVNSDKKRRYSDELIQQLKAGNLIYLKLLSVEDRNDRKFMEPLLYAVKNSKYNTYEVFIHYGEDLQTQDLTIPTEIVKEEPKLIADTVISKNDTIILQLVRYNPKVIVYISDDLKNDGEFIEELCEIGDKEITMYAVRECDIQKVIEESPELANNKQFMKEAIKQDENTIFYLSEELKNNHEFIKETCEANKEVINYVSEHTDEFGTEGLEAAKEVLVENTTCRAIDEMQEQLAKIELLKSDMHARESFDKESKECKKILNRERQLKNNIKFIEKIRNGEVSQERAVRIINSLCENMDENYKKDLLKYVKMDDAIIERSKQNEKEEHNNEKKDLITPKQIEKATLNDPISKINGTTREIRKEYVAERGEGIIQNGEEISEIG